MADATKPTNLELVDKGPDGLLTLNKQGQEALRQWVTDIDDNVYAFTPEADAQAVSAAMARLSRNPNDLRAILAAEFMGEQGKDQALLRRVVNQFGDDSVMQLYPLQVVFEGISNLATKEVEWGRLAAYLEQSTRYLRFDHKDKDGKYAYFTPDELDPETSGLYEEAIDDIFAIYSELYLYFYEYIMQTSDTAKSERDAPWRRACHAGACDGVRSLLPAATKATVGVVGSSQALNNMIFHLRSHELPEMHKLGQKALTAVRGVAPVFFERTDMPERGDLISNHRKLTRDDSVSLASELLDHLEYEKPQGPYVKLLGTHESEDMLVAKILADSSQHPFDVISDFVSTLSEEEKQRVISTYVGERYNRRAKPGRAFELPHYTFEVQCDYGAFRDIQRHRMVDGLDWQPLNTELGHVIPKILDEIPDKKTITELYEKAFQISAYLYTTLQSRGYEQQAQYATLFGNIMRFSFTVNARSLVHTTELRTTPQGHPAYRKVYQDIHELVAGVHPNIAAAMRFVNQDEDERLARLGAEKYSQQKYGES